MKTSRRVWVLTLAFLVGGCATQQVAVPASPSPSAAPTATPRPTNATTDVIYVRQQGTSGGSRIKVIDARTGTVRLDLQDGVISPDGKLVYSVDQIDGGTRTVVSGVDLASGKLLRSATLQGAFRHVYSGLGPTGLTPDGRWLALATQAVQIDGSWVHEFAVVDLRSGSATTTGALKGASAYGYTGLSRDGRSLYLADYANYKTRMLVYDLAAQAFAPAGVAGWDERHTGYTSPFVRSADGRWLFTLHPSGDTPFLAGDGPFVHALDLVARRAVRIGLPAAQKVYKFEHEMLWSLLPTPDGLTLYVVNPAIGVVNELDLRLFVLRRTSSLRSAREADDVLAQLRQFLFPVAEAKRVLRSGAVLSPDGRTLYVAGDKGIAVIDTSTLDSSVWGEGAFDSLALSPDGVRLYAISDLTREIAILDSRDGSLVGSIPAPTYTNEIVRIDAGP